MFFCNSYCSYQKGAIEENHTLLRRIFPKGTLFYNLTQEDINLVSSHINSYYRDSIDDTPYQLMESLYGKSILNDLGIVKIKPSEVVLNTNLIIK